MIRKRQWNMQMEWSWMAGESGSITLSQREPTRPPLASTWAGQPIAEVVAAVVEEAVEVLVVGVIPIMTEHMTGDMTDMKNMIIVTGGDHLHLTIVVTDHGQDLVPTAQGATKEEKQLQIQFLNSKF